MASENEGSAPLQKKLCELRVIDLRSELDKRGLEKGGIKAALTERLKKALEAEGKNPDEFLFDVADGTPAKKPKGHNEEKEVEDEEEEMMAIDEVGGDDETKVLDEIGETDADAIILNMEDDDMMNDDSNVKMVEMNGGLEPVKEGRVDGVVNEVKEENSLAKEDGNKTMDCGGSTSRAPTPPAPTSVPVSVPFTAEDTVNLGSSAERKDDDLSLIVHVDDTLDNDTLDNDILGTPMRNATNDADLQMEAEPVEQVNDKVDVAPGDKPLEGVAGLLDAEDNKENSATPTTSTAIPLGEVVDDQKKENVEAAKSDTKKDGSEKTKSPASKDAKTGSKDGKSKSTSGRNLWVSGLSSTTKATDLKALFSKHGKVEGAKVVTNAKSPGSRCYGLVTMGSADEASKCIQYLHRTELSGRMISVERARNDPSAQASSKQAAAKKQSSASTSSTQKKDKDNHTSSHSHSHHHEHDKDKKEGDRKSKERRHSSSISSRRHSGHRGERKDEKKDEKKDHKKEEKKEGDKKDTKKEKDILSFDKIKEERERERLRQRERRLREEERRKIIALNRERRIQLEEARKLKDEAIRLEREKTRLRIERERLEREKLEAERMERERMRLERERRERERLEREREEQRRMEQARMQERSASKRTFDSRGMRDDPFYESKRPAMGDRFSSNGGYEDSRGGGSYERRVEKYDRREGRGMDGGSRRDVPSNRYADRRDGAPSRREPLRRETASGREERRYEDRSREEPRGFGGRYEDRPLSHESRGRHSAPENGRESRQISDRRAGRSGGHDWKSGHGHDRRDSRPYAAGGGRDQWNDDRKSGVSTNWPSGGDRSGSSGARWSGGSGGGGSGIINNSNQFLESAANIMMGVGASSSRGGGGGSDRYNSYKNSLTGSGRRY